jgi:aminomethyltransferase
MADNSPVKQSPIHALALKMGARFTEGAGWEVPTLFSDRETERLAAIHHVALADVSDRGKIIIEGQTAETALAMPSLSIGDGLEVNGRYIFRLRADQFFVSTQAGYLEAVMAELNSAAQASGELITVTDLTHGRSQFLVIGPKAADLLSHLCGLDFHHGQFPNLAARQSSVAKTRQLILRHDLDGLPVYALIGARSLAEYLWKTILEAGKGLSILPVGQGTGLFPV